MNETSKCPYCGKESYPKRTVKKEVQYDGMTGKPLSEHGSDYTTCPHCGMAFGSGYGIVYL